MLTRELECHRALEFSAPLGPADGGIGLLTVVLYRQQMAGPQTMHGVTCVTVPLWCWPTGTESTTRSAETLEESLLSQRKYILYYTVIPRLTSDPANEFFG